MFAGIILLLTFLNYESPRYLVKRGQDHKAIENLARVRNLPIDHEVIIKEIGDSKWNLP